MIEAIQGYPGYGKSYFAVAEGRKWLKRGGKVYANFQMDGAKIFRLTSNSFDLWDEDKLIWVAAPLHFPVARSPPPRHAPWPPPLSPVTAQQLH